MLINVKICYIIKEIYAGMAAAVCLSMMGAMRSYPTVRMEMHLDLMPLHLVVER